MNNRESIDFIEEIFKKQSPKKVKISILEDCYLTCPTCDKNLIVFGKQEIYFPFKFCPYCGQRLEWD